MSVHPVSEARATLPHLLDLVEQGEEVTITRHGRPVAVLVRPDLLRARRSSAAMGTAASIERMLEEGRRTSLRDLRVLPPGTAEARVAELRADRDAG